MGARDAHERSTRELIHEFREAPRILRRPLHLVFTNPGVRQTTIEPVDTDVDGHSVVRQVRTGARPALRDGRGRNPRHSLSLTAEGGQDYRSWAPSPQ